MIPLFRAGLVALICAAALAAPAAAHAPSDAYLSLSERDGRIEGRWDIALRDLDHATRLDADDDGAVTWGELRRRQDVVAEYALGRLRIERTGKACSLDPAPLLVERHGDATYAVLPFAVGCDAATGPIGVSYALFFDLDPQHRGLIRFDDGTRTLTSIASPERRDWRIDPGPAPVWPTLRTFAGEGVTHIWGGVDHLLFLLALLLPAVLRRRAGVWVPVADAGEAVREVVAVVTAFTAAHSITLALATFGWITLSPRLVEPVIAASIVFAALNNVFPMVTRGLWAVAFGFGLVHGIGFADALRGLGLPPAEMLLPLAGFNLGVELGQLAIVAAFLPLALWLRNTRGYRTLGVGVGSLLVAATAALWLVERAFDVTLLA